MYNNYAVRRPKESPTPINLWCDILLWTCNIFLFSPPYKEWKIRQLRTHTEHTLNRPWYSFFLSKYVIILIHSLLSTLTPRKSDIYIQFILTVWSKHEEEKGKLNYLENFYQKSPAYISVAASQVMVMAIIFSLILLFMGIGILVIVHVCIGGSAFRSVLIGNVTIIETSRRSIGNTSRSRDDLEKLPCYMSLKTQQQVAQWTVQFAWRPLRWVRCAECHHYVSTLFTIWWMVLANTHLPSLPRQCIFLLNQRLSDRRIDQPFKYWCKFG